jgi:prepilin-type N-terminal cleavage/methylation domain-containing protein
MLLDYPAQRRAKARAIAAAGKKLNNMLRKLNKNRGGFTLVEIMIVVAIIALLAAIAVPGFLRARKRAQASRVLNDLRLIDSAVDQYAIENNKTTGATVPVNAWTSYMKQGSLLYNTGQDMFSQPYGAQTIDSLPKVPLSTWNTLSDVAGTAFFSPYGHL